MQATACVGVFAAVNRWVREQVLRAGKETRLQEAQSLAYSCPPFSCQATRREICLCHSSFGDSARTAYNTDGVALVVAKLGIERMSGGASENREIGFCEETYVDPAAEVEISAQRDETPESPWSYAVKRGKKPISLNGIEWRILQLLASRPYHAFTPRHIADAVTTDSHPVTEESLRGHILSLREKLGFFADYVQTVPYIGYRFRE